MRLKTRNWVAHSWSKDFSGRESFLTVVGEVETTNSNQKVSLTKAKPQGINPKILILKLAVTSEGSGSDIVKYKHIGYLQAEGAGQYESVTITGDCDEVTVPVIAIIS